MLIRLGTSPQNPMLRGSSTPSSEQVSHPSDYYRLLFDRNLAGVFCKVVEGPILDCNESLAHMFGCASREEMLALQPQYYCFDRAAQERFTSLIREKHVVTNLEVSCRRKDGTPIWILENAALLEGNDLPSEIVVGSVIDITERKQAEKVLQERTSYLNALIESNPLAILVLDSDHRVQMCNRAFERLFLHRLPEIHECRLDELIAPNDLMEEAAQITRKVMSGETVHLTTRRLRKDRSLVEVELHCLPLVVEGRLTGSYALYQDISERKEAEDALRELSGRLLQLQDDERRRIALDLHDTIAQSLAALGTNLSLVSNCSAVLGSRALAAISESIGLASECSRELRTISYLLHPPLLDDVGLGSAVRWYVEGFAQRSGIHIHLNICPDLGRLPREVETALFRIVQEGLTNVHRHSGSPTGYISIGLNPAAVWLEIRDQGRGMSSEMLRRARSSAATLGVGIVGMRERVRQLGGELEIDSMGNGTTVRVVLPIRGADS